MLTSIAVDSIQDHLFAKATSLQQLQNTVSMTNLMIQKQDGCTAGIWLCVGVCDDVDDKDLESQTSLYSNGTHHYIIAKLGNGFYAHSWCY